MDYLDSKSLQSTECSKSVASHHSQNSGSIIQQPFLSSTGKDNVKVVIRVRPFNEREKTHGGSKKCITVDNSTTITIEQKPDSKFFSFDFVGDEDLDQSTVFTQIAKPIADCCLEGYNGTIFAYGQTGAGKTFTIQGPSIMTASGEEQMLMISKKDGQVLDKEYEKVGLMPRAFEYIFDMVEQAKSKAEEKNEAFTYLIRCSYLEIYNEQIMDLLDPSSINLHIREDLKKGVYVEGLIEEQVSSSSEMVSLISRGSRNRHTGCTSMNKESSRSHSVLTTIIETKSMKDGGGVWNIKSSRFHIIDLAGSERQKFTGAVGERLKEAGMINKSLSALGNVINSLVDISEGKNRHVHYRDSKLTFLLRDSLGGNSKTVIIANISPSSINYGETMSTLKFAQRAKLIRNKAVINEDSSGTISLLRSEINRLKKDLAESEYRAQSLGQQCAFCRNGVNQQSNNQNNQLENTRYFDDDIDLLSESFNGLVDDIEGATINAHDQSVLINEKVKNRLKYQKVDLIKMRERVVYLEGLLSSNLDNMTSQQKFYENEIQKRDIQNKKLQQSVESYEKQCTRDKMIIKFREDRILKLEQSSSQKPETSDEKTISYTKIINDMKKELLIWKESSDHNAQASKLFAEKAELNNKLESLTKELKQTPDSLSAQMRSMSELNDSLNQYLKQYCEDSKKQVEQEMAKQKQEFTREMESMKEKMDDIERGVNNKEEKMMKEENQLKQNLIQQKSEIDRLKKDFTLEKEELEKINKQTLEQIKYQFEQVSGDKSEQELELQHLKIKLIEIQKDQEKEILNYNDKIVENKHKEQELQEVICKLEGQVKDFEEQLKQLEIQQKKLNDYHKSQADDDKNLFTSQLNEQSEIFEKKLFELEKQIMDDQNERDIIFEKSEQLNVRIKSLEDENEGIQRTIIYKEEEIKECLVTINEKQQRIDQLNENILQLYEQDNSKVDEISKLQEDKSSLMNEINELKDNIQQHVKDQEELNCGMDQVNEELSNLKQEKQQLVEDLNNRQIQIQELLSTIQSIQQDQNVLIKEYEQKIIQKEEQNKLQIIAIKQDENEKVNQKDEELRSLEDKVDSLESQIFEIKETRDELKQKIVELNKNIIGLDKEKIEVKEINDQLISQIQVIEQEKQDMQLDKAQLIIQTEQLKNQNYQLVQQQEKSEENKGLIVNDLEVFKETCQKLKEERILSENNLNQIIQGKEQEIQLIQNQIQEKENQIQQQEVIREQLSSQIGNLIEKENEYQQTITLISEQLTKDKIQFQKDSQDYKEQILKEKQEKIELAEGHIQKIQSIEQKYEEDLQKSYQQQEIQMQEIQRQQEVIIQEFKIQKDSQIEEIIKDQDIKIVEIQNKHLEEIQNLKVENQEQIKQLIIKQEELQQELIDKYQEQIETIITEKSIEVQTIQQSLEYQINLEKNQLTSQIEDKQFEFETIVKELNTEINSLQSKLLEEDQSYKTQVTTKEVSFKEQLQKQEFILKQELELKITQILQEKQLELQEQEEDKNKIEEELQSRILELTQDNEQSHQQNKNLENKLKNLALQKEQSKTQYDETILSLQNDYDTKISILQKQLDGWAQYKKNLDEQLNQISSSFESQLKMKDQVITQMNQQNLQRDNSVKDIIQSKDVENSQIREKIIQISEEKAGLINEIQNYKQQDSSNKVRMQEAQVKVQSLQKDVEMQKKLLDNTLEQLNNEHIRKYQEIENEHLMKLNSCKQEIDQYKIHQKELSSQNQKLKERNDEQKEMLRNSKDTISGMVSKENDLMVELEKKINELKDHQDGYRKRAQDLREEKDQIKKEWERLKKENDNLRELVKLKDRQIEETNGSDEKDREAIEKVTKENKDMRNQLIKRDFEMKEIIKTLKLFGEEKNRLTMELDKLQRENDQLIGHKNPNQKIQHHLKIKEENNKLREENFKLMEDLRRKTTILAKGDKGKDVMQEDENNSNNALIGREEVKKLKKENINYQETINRLVDHILSQPGLMKILGLSEDTNEKIQQQTGTGKVKNAMEIISLFTSVLQAKEREFKDVQREKKKIECRLDIVEKEKNLCKQQLELHQQSSGSNSFIQPSNNVSYTAKSPNASVNRLVDNQMFYQIEQQQNQHLNPNRYENNYSNNNSQGRLQVDGFENKMGSNDSGNNIGFSKKSPSPLYNFKQSKEKENISSKRDLFNNQRSGSGRRAAYLSKQQQQ